MVIGNLREQDIKSRELKAEAERKMGALAKELAEYRAGHRFQPFDRRWLQQGSLDEIIGWIEDMEGRLLGFVTDSLVVKQIKMGGESV